ncbi:hypothetical protein K0T92_14625 [Paenibacillus oenotherae]|uniref:Uncharacterized protein n=1 Tax=Paenibacillus oenotherae TaxID=1435645 RepID=A0ABS7D871_9BACL|nr:hypothetical protein [Paenibacillus oenotherae]MBW7475978.1 hypothetical protein [Paenibacillus oenotherae]
MKNTLEKRINNIAGFAQILSKQLVHSGNELTNTGALPSNELASNIQHLLSEFDLLKEEMINSFNSIDFPIVNEVTTIYGMVEEYYRLERSSLGSCLIRTNR